MDTVATKETCIVKGCDRPARSRGLCNSCYTSALDAVKSGRTTWPKLIKAGLALDIPRNPLAVAIDGLEETGRQNAAQRTSKSRR